MAIHKTADIQHSLKSEAVRALELSNQLHSTLELEKLFEIFTREISRLVAYDGLKYTHPEALFSTEIGNQKRHKCQYRLLMGGQNLRHGKRFSVGRHHLAAKCIGTEFHMLEPRCRQCVEIAVRQGQDEFLGMCLAGCLDHFLFRSLWPGQHQVVEHRHTTEKFDILKGPRNP